ncbi:hypothetical protein LV779_34285 [Streptomyces thinghirensis]|nr:hypothetical protein [Streptomyces thinghirensis]
MITSLDGYAEAAEGDPAPGPTTRRCIPSSTTLPPRRHVPLRPTDVRDDALLGDRARRARPAAAHPAVRPRLAGRREGRVLHDA